MCVCISYTKDSEEVPTKFTIKMGCFIALLAGLYWTRMLVFPVDQKDLLDSRLSNGKLWKLVKNIGKEQPQVEKCNTIKNRDGTVARDDGLAANILSLHYQNISKLIFIGEDRHIRSRASDIVHGCRSKTQDIIPIFNRDFTLQELEAAIADSKLNKSPGPDGIHEQMINKLSSIGRHRFLDIINGSWKIGRLPRGWRRAIVIPIRNPCKDAGAPESFRPIALTCIACKIMEKMILKRLTFYLNSLDLLSKEQ
ncbi:hypothetical protein AVEN_254366-1 [Araneus ventricosus]|uniref:Reverse transcriptase domain-containing protein n=1 Tax=Araneus ventricosus TaxID=182803 RepID=A0A4Y2KGT1_ARAVE|nr:hypothetical protein AVEN_254366-1 [Araneus ventricosus]